MTEYIVFSDVHAILPALRSLQEEADNRIPIFLGDVLGWGTDPLPVMNRLHKWLTEDKNSIALIGNHDAVALGFVAGIHGEEEEEVDRRHAELISDTHRQWLKDRKVEQHWMDGYYLGHDEFSGSKATHGLDLHGRAWGYVSNTATNAHRYLRHFTTQYPNARLVMVGHGHKPYLARYNRETGEFTEYTISEVPITLKNLSQRPALINVGSLGLPRDDFGAAYIIFEQGTTPDTVHLQFRSLRFDVSRLLGEDSSFQQETYPKSMRENIYDSLNLVKQPE